MGGTWQAKAGVGPMKGGGCHKVVREVLVTSRSLGLIILRHSQGEEIRWADHWIIQIEKVLEAMEITSDTTRIRLAVFQLESEAQIWWKWARTS